MEIQELLPLSQQIKRLYSRRMAKYNSIIKRMDYVHQVKIINGSRKMLKALLIYVERTFRETEIFHEKLMALISEDSVDYDDT